ncbi:MAG: DUF1015 domain-containing protein [Deltaproteobacteria bacterium]|nr:DUF1015 domain-containing protein [Deltaproteobacteria bacterium]
MVSFQPFRGFVYHPDEIKRHGTLLTSPPYDVLTDGQREFYYSSHEHNFLHVDLGRVLDGDVDGMAWHERSGRLLKEWLEGGVLVRTDIPAVFLVETSWIHPLTGEPLTRHGFIGLMRLEEPGPDAAVRLHEQTFSFHKMERLDLMLKTQAQLSPIFGFFPDPGNASLNLLYSLAADRLPDIALKDGAGEEHRVYFLTRPEEYGPLTLALSRSTVYIADGHHRYMTTLNYRRELSLKLAREKAPPLPPESPLDYVMTYLSPMGDPGLCVLPTHRILKTSPYGNDELLRRLGEFADVRLFSHSDGGKGAALETLKEKLQEDSKKGLTVFGLFLNGADYFVFVKVKEKAKEALSLERPEESSLSLLDVSILTNVILKKGLSLTEDRLDDPDCISYVSETAEALELVEQGARAAFILNPTSLSDILKVTEAGFVMPRKATYFYPKVRNGLVINVVDPYESLSAPAARRAGEGAC